MTSRLAQSTLCMLVISAVFAASVATGCSSTPDEVADEAQTTEPRPSPDFSEAPENYSTAGVLGVVAAPGGSAVMLGSTRQESVLPIFINSGQAMAIQLGLDGEDFERPLTHDLVADIIARLDAEIAKVQVDDLRDGTFIATVFLITPTEVLEIDARPSDAIALAVKDEITIYVADHVFEEAGLTDEHLRQLPPADPGDPDDFHDSPTTPL